MSIFGSMRTSVSGMNAQASRLSTFSENIANSGTVGYKATSAQFRTLLANQSPSEYTSGGVDTLVRYGIDQQGVINATSSPTDLAIRGGGFFVVADSNGAPHLTRAGSFLPDASGYLVNAAGFRLMGLPAGAGSGSTGLSGLSPIKVNMSGLSAWPSTQGAFVANLPAKATATAAANLPSANAATAAYAAKSSLIAYDNLGGAVDLDVYLAKTADNQWELSIFDASARGPSGFPYSSGPLQASALGFDPANGALQSPSPSLISVAVPGGKTLSLDLTGMTQLKADFSVSRATVDGGGPSNFTQLVVDGRGVISAKYANGVTAQQSQVYLASAASIDNLAPLSGNVYDETYLSGTVAVGKPGVGPLGDIISSSLEASTVDMATELTGMIETQRAYTANSKAFQAAADMSDVLVNLKV